MIKKTGDRCWEDKQTKMANKNAKQTNYNQQVCFMSSASTESKVTDCTKWNRKTISP